MLLIGLTACKDGVTEPTYPINIPYEKYDPRLKDENMHSSCDWNYWRFFWDYENGSSTLTVINSNEELESYIECIYEKKYTEIDFSKYSLILVNGYYQYIGSITKCLLQQISKTEYQLDIEKRYQEGFDATDNWILALIVDKLSKNNNIELNVTYKHKYEKQN